MKKVYSILIIVLLVVEEVLSSDNFIVKGKLFSGEEIDSLYQLLNPLEPRPSYKAFYGGLMGYAALIKEDRLQNSRYLTVIDFSMSSKTRRLWVIDLYNMTVIHNSLVAHGKNTGEEFAVKFSNTPKSNMSSLGFYVTGSTYYGKYGLSLKLDGIEQGINDNARKRAIVIHSAQYATWNFINKYGRLGRSFGCPALPPTKSAPIIETIKDKSCLFIYFPDKEYLVKSKYLNVT